jgi:hypothetical protein
MCEHPMQEKHRHGGPTDVYGEPSLAPEERRDKSGVRVARTSVGKGVFAMKRILPCTVIGEIQGSLISEAHYTSDYCFDFEDGRQLEPAAPFRFVNHSCEPNCTFELCDIPNNDGSTSRHLYLFALKEIRPTEELTIEYNWSANAAIPCRCGEPSCRGWIVDPSELDQLPSNSAVR